jgi:GGDEF domain-containing protein
MSNSFYEDQSRLLTRPAFEFVFDAELKRAVRSQTFLTLFLLEAKREWDDLMVAADESTVAEVGRVVSHVVRDTDLVSKTGEGVLALVLLDANFEDSAHVVDRLVTRIDSYGFVLPLHISIGAACFPTHAVDSDSLKRQAMSRPVANWRSGPSTFRTADSQN